MTGYWIIRCFCTTGTAFRATDCTTGLESVSVDRVRVTRYDPYSSRCATRASDRFAPDAPADRVTIGVALASESRNSSPTDSPPAVAHRTSAQRNALDSVVPYRTAPEVR